MRKLGIGHYFDISMTNVFVMKKTTGFYRAVYGRRTALCDNVLERALLFYYYR